MNDAKIEARIATKLQALYPEHDLLAQLRQIITQYPVEPRSGAGADGLPLLIAYGDHIHHSQGGSPLQALHTFMAQQLGSRVGGVHLLPFYPYTSDDGFSVADYLTVDPTMGDWPDIEAFRPQFRLMFDLVLNHASVSSEWFQRFLRDEAPYNDYFVTADPKADLTAVVRPRTHPLLTPFETAAGIRHVWTTFSTDQADLNFANPHVLMEMVRILLEYVQRGADYIRLDAVAFLWKTVGANCIHLPQTHLVIQLLRDVLEIAAPWVMLITETNVPHHENILYFGDGHNEAHLVYQFALPPLLLHTLYMGDAAVLTDWAASLHTPSAETGFFNFTASHDGIGVRPVAELLPPAAIGTMLENVQARGGQISYRAHSDGSRSPYELNITYFDALAQPGEPLMQSVDRFLVSQAIMLALAGLPAIYLPSLFGAANWHEGVAETGRARTINRQKFELPALIAALNRPGSREQAVFARYTALLEARARCSAFQEPVPQRILKLDSSVFALQRGTLLALHNVSDQAVTLPLPDDEARRDLLSDARCAGSVILNPYQILWLESGR